MPTSAEPGAFGGAVPPVVSFVARSGTGKTTFLEKLIPALRRRGVRVLVVKHDVHGFEVDKPGKDTHRLRQAGAHRVLIANADQMALMGASDGDAPLFALVERYGMDVDLVISEGYRRSGLPKILVVRDGAREALDPALVDPLVAVVSDRPRGLGVPDLPLDDPEPCADFLVSRWLGATDRLRALTGVILAGGRSSRMGRDKAALEFRGRPLLPALIERLRPLCPGGILVVQRPGQGLGPLEGARVVEDLLPAAALGGLFTGLALAETPFVFLTACDLPLLDAELIAWLRDRPGRGADVLMPMRDGRAEPTHAIYGHRCLGAIKRAMLSGELSLHGWLGAVRVERIEEEAWRAVHPSGASFLNVNTPEDLARAEAEGGER